MWGETDFRNGRVDKIMLHLLRECNTQDIIFVKSHSISTTFINYAANIFG